MSALRSLLFCPASEPVKLAKAFASSADAVVADLEDSVADSAKDIARAALRDFVREHPELVNRLMIRINTDDPAVLAEDLLLVSEIDPLGVLVPKATPAVLARISSQTRNLLPIIETAKGVNSSAETAQDPRVVALVFGAIDLAAEVSFRGNVLGTHLLYCRSKIAIDSAAAGIQPPIDSVFAQFRDEEGLRADTSAARDVGFQGKCCIHPSQLDIVHEIFGSDDLDWALETLSLHARLASEHAGVGSRNGEMVDMATVRRARRIVEKSGAYSDRVGETERNLS